MAKKIDNNKDKRPSLDSKKLANIFSEGKGKEVPVLVDSKGILISKPVEKEIEYSWPSLIVEKELLASLKIYCINKDLQMMDVIRDCMIRALNNEYSDIKSAGMLGLQKGEKLGTKIPKETYHEFKIWLAKNNFRLRDVLVHALKDLLK